jgi:dihydrolipoamide dehydrogenase
MDADGAPSRYHTIVVGAGSGGLTVAIGLARLGRRVALVERAAVGGDCTNVGCIPSKTLIELAAALGPPPAPGASREAWARRTRAVLDEVRLRRDALRAHEERTLATLARLDLVRGAARLVPRHHPFASGAGRAAMASAGSGAASGAASGATTPGATPTPPRTRSSRGTPASRGRPPDVVITGEGATRRLRAANVVLATGSSPVVAEVDGLPAERTLTNVTLFDLGAPPDHLAILGAGATGCEMAFAFARLGSTVTLLDQAPRVLPRSEPEAARIVRRSLAAAGVRVLTGAAATRFEPDGGRLHVRLADDAVVVEGVEAVLMVVGRRPNVAGLGLTEVGAPLADGGVVTDAAHHTPVPGLWAIGDVTGRVHATHAAHAQGRRLVRRLALPLPLVREGDYPSLTFAEPEVAQIGPTLAALQARYPADLLVSHRIDLADTDRGLTLGLEQGYLRVTAMRLTGRLLAATVVAPNASEIIHLLTLAQRRRMSLWRLSRLVIAYPTLSEAIRQAADAFVFASLPRLHRELATYLRLRWRRPTPA